MKAVGDLRGRDADEFGTHFVERQPPEFILPESRIQGYISNGMQPDVRDRGACRRGD